MIGAILAATDFGLAALNWMVHLQYGIVKRLSEISFGLFVIADDPTSEVYQDLIDQYRAALRFYCYLCLPELTALAYYDDIHSDPTLWGFWRSDPYLSACLDGVHAAHNADEPDQTLLSWLTMIITTAAIPGGILILALLATEPMRYALELYAHAPAIADLNGRAAAAKVNQYNQTHDHKTPYIPPLQDIDEAIATLCPVLPFIVTSAFAHITNYSRYAAAAGDPGAPIDINQFATTHPARLTFDDQTYALQSHYDPSHIQFATPLDWLQEHNPGQGCIHVSSLKACANMGFPGPSQTLICYDDTWTYSGYGYYCGSSKELPAGCMDAELPVHRTCCNYAYRDVYIAVTSTLQFTGRFTHIDLEIGMYSSDRPHDGGTRIYCNGTQIHHVTEIDLAPTGHTGCTHITIPIAAGSILTDPTIQIQRYHNHSWYGSFDTWVSPVTLYRYTG